MLAVAIACRALARFSPHDELRGSFTCCQVEEYWFSYHANGVLTPWPEHGASDLVLNDYRQPWKSDTPSNEAQLEELGRSYEVFST